MRRTALHAALLDAATAAGVWFVHEAVGEVTQDSTSVRPGTYALDTSPLPTGCTRPSVDRSAWTGLAGPRRWGIRRHIAPWTDYVEVHWARGAEAYVTPVGDDCVGIAILTSHKGDSTAISTNSSLKDRVHGLRTARTAPPARCGKGSQPNGRSGPAGWRRSRLRRRADRRRPGHSVRCRRPAGGLRHCRPAR